MRSSQVIKEHLHSEIEPKASELTSTQNQLTLDKQINIVKATTPMVDSNQDNALFKQTIILHKSESQASMLKGLQFGYLLTNLNLGPMPN